MRPFRIRRSTDWPVIERLHRAVFPYDKADETLKDNTYWVVWEGSEPVGFCAIRELSREPGVAFLSRSGVLKSARGCGLQRRMIKVRQRWAASQGMNKVVTYTARNNFPSAVNLLKCGFEFYEPDWNWGGVDSLYFTWEPTE